MRFQKKIVGWKGKILGLDSKVQLVKSCLQNILIYYLSLFKMPCCVVDKIEKIQKCFLWTGMKEKSHMSLVSWEKVCSSKGGLGIRKLKPFNRDLISKIGWQLVEGIKE